jgi:hypothetical protein
VPNKLDLKNIANSIVSTFNSRNNDIDGYWAIGKLFQRALDEETKRICIDLKKGTVNENHELFVSLIDVFRNILKKKLAKHGLSETCLRSARIFVDFDCAYDSKYHKFCGSTGAPYICSCELSYTSGNIYSVKAGGRCWPHDPVVESKRGDFADI